MNEKGFEQNKFNTPWYNELGSFNGRTDINKDGKTFSEVYPNESSFYGCAIKEEHKKEFSIQSYSAPTIAEVVMWLYETFGIYIESRLQLSSAGNEFIPYFNCTEIPRSTKYTTPLEAYTQAILYTLNNLV